MVWTTLDDGFPDHPKVLQLSDAAFRLHVAGLCYCNRLLTDGNIPTGYVSRLVPNFKTRTFAELLDSSVWHSEGHSCASCPQPQPGCVYVHDFLATNRSKERVLAEREKKAAAGRRGGKATAKARAEANAEAGAATTSSSASLQHAGQYSLPSPSPSFFEGGKGEARCEKCDDRGWVLPDSSSTAVPCPDCKGPHLKVVS